MKQVTENNPELLKSILDHLLYQEDGSIKITSEAFDLINIFVDHYFDTDFLQVIINSLDTDTDLRKVARILDILIWSTPDNGAKLSKLLQGWIISDDYRKVEIILKREDEFPRDNLEEIKSVLKIIKQKFPNYNKLCDYHIEEFEYWGKTHNRRMELFYQILKETE